MGSAFLFDIELRVAAGEHQLGGLEASMLTRVWCVYELFYSVQMRKKIDFASPDGLLSSTRKFTQYQRRYAPAVAQAPK